MKFLEEKRLTDFDAAINKYLVFLVHAQKSTFLQITDKITIFDRAKNIAAEIRANVQKTLNNVNEYNVEEKRKYIREVLLKIEAIIINEINNCKKVKISDESLFLVNNIIENLMTDANGIKLVPMDISNIYSFKELNRDREKTEYMDAEMQKIKENLNIGLEEIKLKAFLKMLHGKNKNPERFYKINNFILEKCGKEEIQFFVSNMPEDRREGLFFIINRKDLTIRRKTSNGLIVYTVGFNDFEERFTMRITGKITVNNSEEEFSIDEIYPNSMRGAVLNTFNLREIISLFNVLYTGSLAGKDMPKNNSDIDNYLDGKIQND